MTYLRDVLGAALTLGSVAGIVVAVASCGDSVDAESEPDPADTGTEAGECGGVTVAPGCNDCSEQYCCAQAQACSPGSRCAIYRDCAAQCAKGDAQCQGGCAATYADGVAPRDAWYQCLSANCYAPQRCTAGGICNQGAYFDNGACDACIQQNCCLQVNACFSNDYAGCFSCLTGGACSPDGQAVLDCRSTNCAGPCGV